MPLFSQSLLQKTARVATARHDGRGHLPGHAGYIFTIGNHCGDSAYVSFTALFRCQLYSLVSSIQVPKRTRR